MFRKVMVVFGLIVVSGLAVVQFAPATGEVDQTAQNKKIVQRVIDDLWNGENLDSVNALYADRFYAHCPDRRVTTLWSPHHWRQLTFETLHGEYSDLQVTVNAMVAEADRVIVDFTARGTHDRDVTVDWTALAQDGLHWYRNIHTIAATGTRDTWDGVLMYRLEDGRIVEEWWYWNGDVTYR